MRRFVEDQIKREVVELVASAIQVGRSALDRLVRDRRLTSGGDEGPTVRFRRYDRRGSARPGVAARPRTGARAPGAGMGQALVVHAPNPVHHADMTGLREECRVVHESPQREEAVHAAGIAVVAKDAADAHHDATSTSTRSCLPGS